jgi:hypothetical protein
MKDSLSLEHDDTDQTSKFNRQRTKPYSPDFTMDELSSQTIIGKIITTKQLLPSETTDSKIWWIAKYGGFCRSSSLALPSVVLSSM